MASSIQQILAAVSAGASSWTTSLLQTLNLNDPGWSNATLRIVVPDTIISTSGSLVRVTLQSGSGNSCALSEVWIGEQATSGDAYDMKASTPAPAQFLFSGSANITIPANSQVVSDALTFAIDETKTYVFGFYITAGDIRYKSSVTGTLSKYYTGGNEAGTANATTGYSNIGAGTGVLSLVAQIEVQ